MHKVVRSILAPLLLSAALTYGLPAYARLVPFSLDRTVDASHLIVLGTIAAIETSGVNRDMVGVEYAATVKTENVLKGAYRKTLTVIYFPKWHEGYELQQGGRYLLFLRCHEGRFFAVQSAGGVAKVLNSEITDISMSNEAPTQPMSTFIAKISAALARPSHTPQSDVSCGAAH